MVPLGEPHNGGRRVCLGADGRVHKPRTLFWEWALLGVDSPARCWLDDLPAGAEAVAGLFDCLPRLGFELGPDLDAGGVAEFVRLEPPSEALGSDAAFWRSLGAVSGLCCWLGLSDLHAKNTVFGRARSGKAVFGPIDVECALHRVELPSQTHLVPSPLSNPAHCGLAEVRSWLRARRLGRGGADPLAALCSGYWDGLDALREAGAGFEEALRSRGFRADVRVRVIPRPTAVYAGLLAGAPVPKAAAPLSSCERFQLERGDIPFYFRPADSVSIFFLDADGRARESSLPEELLARIRRQSETWAGWRSPERVASLETAGALQLLRYLSEGMGDSTASHRGATLELGGPMIRLTARSGGTVQCRRG